MSRETTEWLNTMTLRGFTDTRGEAWHYSIAAQGDESNHYPGAIPVEDVRRRLLNWTGLSVPLTYTVPALPEVITADGVSEAIPERTMIADGRIAVIRSDTGACLGIFKDSYTVHNFDEWLLGNIATILDDDLSIGSAGLLRGGAVCWVQVDVPENITTPEGVTFRPHLFGTTSHDGSLATTFGRSVTMIVCDNTLDAAVGEADRHGQRVKVKHSKNSGFRINDAREALGIVHTIADDFAAEVASLCQIKVAPKKFTGFLDKWAPIPTDTDSKRVDPRAITVAERKREDLTQLYRHDPRVAPWTGTAFGVLQAVNTYGQHVSAVRVADATDEQRGALRYSRSIMQAADGTLAKNTVEARELLMAVL